MGFKENWKRLVAWWSENARSNEKKLSAGFSWLLVIIISGITIPIIAMLQGEIPNWNAFFIVVVSSSAGFLIMLIESIFGKMRSPNITPINIPEPIKQIEEEL